MTTVQAIEGKWVDSDAGTFIYYPLWFVELEMSWKRLLLPSRTESLMVCVDAVRDVAYRVDVSPSSTDRDVPDEALVPLCVERDGAVRRATDLARWWAGTRLLSWWAPRAEVRSARLLHKVYVMEEHAGRRVLRDSLTGESGAL